MGSIIEKEIKDCAVKNHKNAALLFPSLITSICIVSGVRLDAKDKHVKNDVPSLHVPLRELLVRVLERKLNQLMSHE